jgi:hypothetical protein
MREEAGKSRKAKDAGFCSRGYLILFVLPFDWHTLTLNIFGKYFDWLM